MTDPRYKNIVGLNNINTYLYIDSMTTNYLTSYLLELEVANTYSREVRLY